MKLKERIAKNSFWSIFATITNRIGAIVFTIILARLLGAADYGIYSITLSVGMILYTFADLGINQATIKYIASSLAKDKKKLSSYYSHLVKLKLILSLTVALIMLALSYPLAIFIFKNPLLLMPFFVVSLYIFVLAMEGFYTNLYYPIEKVKYIGIKEVLSQFLRITISLLIILFAAESYKVAGIFAGGIITSVILLFYLTFFLKKVAPQLFKKSKFKLDSVKIIKFIGFLTIATISTAFFSYVDSVMLGLFLPQHPEFVGFYKAAFSLVVGIIGLLAAPTIILLPILSKVKQFQLQSIINKGFAYLSIIGIPASFGFLLLGRYFLVIFFGVAYLPAVLPLYFLSFLILPSIAITLFSYLFVSQEKSKIFAKLIVLSALINVALNFIFIKSLLAVSFEWAMAGAAIATLISWLIYFFLATIIIRRDFKISLAFSPLVKSLIASLLMFIILFYVDSYIADMTLIKGIFIIILGVIIYLPLMFLFKAINRSDLAIIKLIFKK